MNQKLILLIGHGNHSIKTDNKIFTSVYVESDCKPAFNDELKKEEDIIWCKPEQVCTVEYMPNTQDPGLFRGAVRLR